MEIYNVFQEIKPNFDDIAIITNTQEQFNYIKSLEIIRKYRIKTYRKSITNKKILVLELMSKS